MRNLKSENLFTPYKEDRKFQEFELEKLDYIKTTRNDGKKIYRDSKTGLRIEEERTKDRKVHFNKTYAYIDKIKFGWKNYYPRDYEALKYAYKNIINIDLVENKVELWFYESMLNVFGTKVAFETISHIQDFLIVKKDERMPISYTNARIIPKIKLNQKTNTDNIIEIFGLFFAFRDFIDDYNIPREQYEEYRNLYEANYESVNSSKFLKNIFENEVKYNPKLEKTHKQILGSLIITGLNSLLRNGKNRNFDQFKEVSNYTPYSNRVEISDIMNKDGKIRNLPRKTILWGIRTNTTIGEGYSYNKSKTIGTGNNDNYTDILDKRIEKENKEMKEKENRKDYYQNHDLFGFKKSKKKRLND